MRCPACGEIDEGGIDGPRCACYYEQQREPEPSIEDYCGADGHAYYGDDGPFSGLVPVVGRCYCGQRLYPPAGHDALATLATALGMALSSGATT